MHRAACIADALRLRHRVHVSLQRGVYQRHEVSLPEGLIGASSAQHVRIEASKLILRDLRGGAILWRWPLPPEYRIATVQDGMRWQGGVLALVYAPGSRPEQQQGSGVLLADLSTGMFTPVLLEQHGSIDQTVWCAPGCLLVQHTTTNGARTFSVISTRGCITAAVAAPHPEAVCEDECFSRNGEAVVLHTQTSLWLWEVQSGRPLIHSKLPFDSPEVILDWSWDSRRLCIESCCGLLIWTSPQEQQECDLPCTAFIGWGRQNRLALLRSDDAHYGPDAALDFAESDFAVLCLYDLLSGCPAPQLVPWNSKSETIRHGMAAEVSPDGRVLCVSFRAASETQQKGVDFLSLDHACLLQRVSLSFEPAEVAWAADGARIIVWDSAGHHCLLEFAS